MRTKIIVLLVVLILALSYYFINKEATNTNIKPSITTTINNANDKPSVQQQIKQLNAKKATDNATKKKMPIIPINSVYDDDPVVDANLILRNNRLCYRHLSKNTRSNKYINQFKQGLEKKQQQYFENYIDHCQKLNTDHPEYGLTDIKKIQKQKSNAIATSYWGKIINGDIDATTLSNYEIQNLLRQNNLSIITDAPKYLQGYYQEVIHWDLEDVLQNHQYDYTNQIMTYAHQYYLCGIGADCGPNSTVMAMFCYLNSQGCGLNYPNYINNVLTHGQQADIQLALVYLQGKYQ